MNEMTHALLSIMRENLLDYAKTLFDFEQEHAGKLVAEAAEMLRRTLATDETEGEKVKVFAVRTPQGGIYFASPKKDRK